MKRDMWERILTSFPFGIFLLSGLGGVVVVGAVLVAHGGVGAFISQGLAETFVLLL